MKKLVYILSLPVFFLFLSCESQIQEIELSSEDLVNSSVFENLFEANIRFNEPLLDKVESLSEAEFEIFYSSLNSQIKNKNSYSKEEYEQIIKEFGYTTVQHYEELYLELSDSYNSLIQEFPSIERMDDLKREQLLSDSFFQILSENSKKFKASDNCVDDYSFCRNRALGAMLFRSIGCSSALLLPPPASLIAAGCQLSNLAWYNSDLEACLRVFKDCQEK